MIKWGIRIILLFLFFSVHSAGTGVYPDSYRFFEETDDFIPVYEEHMGFPVSPGSPIVIRTSIRDPETSMVQVLVWGSPKTNLSVVAEHGDLQVKSSYGEEGPGYPLFLLIPLIAGFDYPVTGTDLMTTITSSGNRGMADIEIRYVYDENFAYGSLDPGMYYVWEVILPPGLSNIEFQVLFFTGSGGNQTTGIYTEPGSILPQKPEEFSFCSVTTNPYSWISVNDPVPGPWLIMVLTDNGKPARDFAVWWTGRMAEDTEMMRDITFSQKDSDVGSDVSFYPCQGEFPNLTLPLSYERLGYS